jgi:hypothetical protein
MWSWLWETTESPNETAHTEKHNSNISCGTNPASPVLLGWNGFQTLKRQSESGASGSSLVNLRTNIHSIYPLMIPQTKLTASVLKSAMQKNVRLCRPTNAVVVGRELQRNSMMEFLRRLAIIILEDAILHPALPLVVWTLIAHSQKDEHQFHPPPQLASALLAIVADIARVGVRDPLGDDVAPVTEEEMRRLRGPEQVPARHAARLRRVSSAAYVLCCMEELCWLDGMLLGVMGAGAGRPWCGRCLQDGASAVWGRPHTSAPLPLSFSFPLFFSLLLALSLLTSSDSRSLTVSYSLRAYSRSLALPLTVALSLHCPFTVCMSSPAPGAGATCGCAANRAHAR